MSKGIAGLLLGLCCGLSQAAELMRWQDSQGQWHFAGPETAGPGAEPVVIAPPSRGLDMKVGPVPEEVSPAPRRKRARRQDSDVDADVADRKPKKETRQPLTKKESCARWRERLRKSPLGLRDHEAQDAYGRECILNMHW